MTDTDRHIIEEIRGGRPRGFAKLVERHKDRAMTLAHRIISNRSEAEEAVQDAFVKAYRSLDQFRGEAEFGTWFYRILYNVCMTRVTRNRDLETVDIWDETLGVEPEDVSPSSLEMLEEKELQAMIGTEIEHLPMHFRVAVTLFYVQELSYEEIAATLQLPLGTVKTNLFRGRALLQRRVLSGLKEGAKAA